MPYIVRNIVSGRKLVGLNFLETKLVVQLHAAVCCSACGSVWQCTRQCVAVRLVVYESVRGSVRLCDSVAVCGCAAGCACVAVR